MLLTVSKWTLRVDDVDLVPRSLVKKKFWDNSSKTELCRSKTGRRCSSWIPAKLNSGRLSPISPRKGLRSLASNKTPDLINGSARQGYRGNRTCCNKEQTRNHSFTWSARNNRIIEASLYLAYSKHSKCYLLYHLNLPNASIWTIPEENQTKRKTSGVGK